MPIISWSSLQLESSMLSVPNSQHNSNASLPLAPDCQTFGCPETSFLLFNFKLFLRNMLKHQSQLPFYYLTSNFLRNMFEHQSLNQNVNILVQTMLMFGLSIYIRRVLAAWNCLQQVTSNALDIQGGWFPGNVPGDLSNKCLFSLLFLCFPFIIQINHLSTGTLSMDHLVIV